MNFSKNDDYMRHDHGLTSTCYAKWYLAPESLSLIWLICVMAERLVIRIWHWLPLMTNTCPRLTEHKWARTRPSLAHIFQTTRSHMFLMLRCWNYDNSVIFMIPILELGLMQPSQLWSCWAAVTIIEVPLVPLHTRTHTQLSPLVYSST